MITNPPEIVLAVTGSIGAYKSADLLRHLRDAGYAVTCVMTHRATQFVTPVTFEALSERKVHVDLFDRQSGRIAHTWLADHTKLIIVAPATANILAKFANGIADDLLSCLLLATRAKILIAPAMNVHMWQHPTVQRNVTTLKRLGHRFAGPDVGRLACGYEAIGHLAETEEILRAARQLVPVAGPSSADKAAPVSRKRTRKRRVKIVRRKRRR